MNSFRRTPLAWKNLTHDRRRLAVAVSGVTFAVVLMFVERGFQNALFDSTVALVRNLNADLVIVSRSRYSLSSSSRFPAHTLNLARGCDHVQAVHPLYLENYLATFRKPNRSGRPIRVVGFDLEEPVFTERIARQVAPCREALRAPGTAMIDVASKRSLYHIDPRSVTAERPETVELAGRKVRLVGRFHLGTDFANDGTLLMSRENFANYFPLRQFPHDPLAIVDLGLIVCRPEADPALAKDQVARVVGHDVLVLTRDEYVAKEISFWDRNTPIGVIFQVGVIMGFVVGVLICYQVLYNDISDHLAEFATLMAMGYDRHYFLWLVVRESIYLSWFGFLPGVLISAILFRLITIWTGLTMRLSLWDTGLILAFTVVMCMVSGLLAVRKLLAADPASLF
jgi:putative ABC transport system permease protein